MAYITERRWFVPKEAEGIARAFEKAAKEVEQQSYQLQNVAGELDATWEGLSHDRFMATFRNEPAQLRSYANHLRDCANRIRAIQVYEDVRVEVPDSHSSGGGYGGGGGGAW